jgi:BMFP domain-containing protein YqiC
MSNDEPQAGPPGMNTFAKMWSDFVTESMRAGLSFSIDRAPPEVSRDMQSQMLKAWGDYCEKFMRSEDFLSMLKQSLSVSVEARKQFNDMLANTQHELQLASRQDVDQIMATLQRMEHSMVDYLEELAARLSDLEHKLADVTDAKQNHETRGSAKKKPARKKSD